MTPKPGETTTTYAARLREKGQECDFGENEDDRILEHLIQTITNQSLIKKAINKSWSLDQFLTEAAQVEDISLQVQQMSQRQETGAYKVTYKNDKRQGHSKFNSKKQWKREQPGRDRCGYCGLTDKHEPGRNCPAYGRKCHTCGRFNHFSTMCRDQGPTGRETRPHLASQQSKARYDRGGHRQHKGKVKRLVGTENESNRESTSSDDEFFTQCVKHLKSVKVIRKVGEKCKTVPVRVDDVDVRIEADSGAEVNIMDEHQYQAFVHRSQHKQVLKPTTCDVSALQNKLSVKGEFRTIIRNATCGVEAKFIVVRGRINSPPLVGKETLENLGMLEIREDGSLRKPNSLRIPDEELKRNVNSIKSTPNGAMAEIVKEFEHLFKGVGKIEDLKKQKQFLATLPMKPTAVPVAQRPRPVPYFLQKPLRDLLEQGLKEDLYEKVPTGEPVTWCSPLVVQPKPKFRNVDKDKLEPNMIRASLDLRIPNKSMERARIVQPPIVEDFIHKFHDCEVFSKLDLRQGYQQLLLDEKSREVTTFCTPWGNYRSKRLVFGAKASQDLFDEAMFRIFGDRPMCLNQRDDVLIRGRNLEEHNATLRTVLQRAADFGITLNKDKCQFGVDQIEFYGYLFTKGNLKPTPEKVRAVRESKPPRSKEEVRSFLGMTGYLSKFVPRYAITTAPLRRLTEKDTKFHWGEEEVAAFQKLKDEITDESTVVYFNPSKPIILRVEASFYEGLAAGLFQETDNGVQPVHFISRSMTDTEKRYSQTEKDALAIRWAKQRFSIYLLGAPKFKIITAHKPLIPMFNKASVKLPPRIERWVMDMQDVDYEVMYEPGRDAADSLDFLSRHPMPEKGNDNVEKVIKNITQNEHAVVLPRIAKETGCDPQLKKICELIHTENWEKERKDPDIAPFYTIKDELSVIEGLVFRLDRIVIPKSLQHTIIKVGHSLGHLGTTKIKKMLREKYWFPSMDSMIETITKQCFECQITSKDHHKEPVKIMPMPEYPWDTVAVDFGGPYPDGHYNLVIIDKRSRYPEVVVVKSTSSETTKKALKSVFATHGTPRRVESDNGPPFMSADFAEFAKEEGFQHHRVTPLHPRANGEAENFMRLLNKTEQIAHTQGEDSEVAIQTMLIGYRSTPHPATGTSPYKGLMNRNVRTKLDYTDVNTPKQPEYAEMNEKDRMFKIQSKMYAEDRYTKEHSILVGDYLLLKQAKKNKWSTAYEPVFYVVYRVNGSSISARRTSDGREITRDSSHFKLANHIISADYHVPEEPKEDSWREELLSTMPKPDTVSVSSEIDIGVNGNVDTYESPQITERQNTVTLGTENRIRRERPVRTRKRPNYLKDYVS